MAFNMDPKKCPMPTQDPNVRNKNFEEVALGYTAEMAVNEAKRCIHCKNKPCQTGCPVGIDIPEFIGHVAEGDFEAAYQVINRSSSLPAVCGRVLLHVCFLHHTTLSPRQQDGRALLIRNCDTGGHYDV